MSYQPPPSQMNPQPGQAPAQYSPDGRWYWDGQRWQPVAAPGPNWARPFATPEARATAAVTLVGIASAASAVLALGGAVDLIGQLARVDAIQIAAGAIDLLGLLAFVAGGIGAVISVPMWIHRVYRNLPALGAQGLRASPAWAAGAWFIPIVAFWAPLLNVREVWTRSGGGNDPVADVVTRWWTLWIVAYATGVVSNIAGRVNVGAGDAFGVLNSAALAIAGVLLIQVIRAITQRQLERARLLHAG